MSAVYIGGYSSSQTIGGLNIFSSASCDFTRVDGLFVSIARSSINHTSAISSKDSVSFDIFSYRLTRSNRSDSATVLSACTCVSIPHMQMHAAAHDCCRRLEVQSA